MPLPIPRFMARARVRRFFTQHVGNVPFVIENANWTPPLPASEDRVDVPGIDPTPLQVARET